MSSRVRPRSSRPSTPTGKRSRGRATPPTPCRRASGEHIDTIHCGKAELWLSLFQVLQFEIQARFCWHLMKCWSTSGEIQANIWRSELNNRKPTKNITQASHIIHYLYYNTTWYDMTWYHLIWYTKLWYSMLCYRGRGRDAKQELLHAVRADPLQRAPEGQGPGRPG